ncbi:MAG: hypothetical protein SRB2_04655 [Desulfobacteraceae bacterium Eth-SRB2]|nr:MAG: hypothetical protein SRB2_04655 [Desulfobacteraceae bacterium Eth-SRB2]
MFHRHIQKNIALKIPYPEISKTVPQLLTTDQYNRLICHFSEWADSSIELRNLILIMLYITTIKVLVRQELTDIKLKIVLNHYSRRDTVQWSGHIELLATSMRSVNSF